LSFKYEHLFSLLIEHQQNSKWWNKND